MDIRKFFFFEVSETLEEFGEVLCGCLTTEMFKIRLYEALSSMI